MTDLVEKGNAKVVKILHSQFQLHLFNLHSHLFNEIVIGKMDYQTLCARLVPKMLTKQQRMSASTFFAAD